MYSNRMIGSAGHSPQCDCNIEEHVSGVEDKCNHRYGNKRARAREEIQWRKEANSARNAQNQEE